MSNMCTPTPAYLRTKPYQYTILQEYQEWVAKVCKANYLAAETGDILELAYLSCGISSEAGEVADLIKDMSRAGYHSLDFIESKDAGGYDNLRDRMIEELGDTVWYITRMAAVWGIPLEEIMRANRNKLEQRAQQRAQQRAKKGDDNVSGN